MLKYAIIILFVGVTIAVVNSDQDSNQDTYLNALQNSHQTNSASERNGDVSFHASPGYEYPAIQEEYGPPSPEYGHPQGPPSPEYGHPQGPPAPVYGQPNAPAPVYGHPPAPVYGHPPAPHYGPPSKPIYGPPPPPSSSIFITHPHPPPFYHPREETWLDKLKVKIDLFTIGKLILKLIVFKKIIKFFAMICLLLLLPKLKNLFGEDMMDDDAVSGEARELDTDKGVLNERIIEANKFAKTAMETFSRKYDGCKRDQIWCRFERTMDVIDKQYPYKKIVKLYLPNVGINTK